MKTKTNLKILSALLLLSIVCNISKAEFFIPLSVPVDRLITNATAYIKENPKDAQGYYILARINYLAFINKSTQVPAFNEGKDTPPKIAETWQSPDYLYRTRMDYSQKLSLKELGYTSYSEIPEEEKEAYFSLSQKKYNELIEQSWKPEEINLSKLAIHITESINNFKKAIKLEPKNGLYYLGLASIYKQYIDYTKEINLEILPDEFRYIILSHAKNIYYDAYNLSIKKDLKYKTRPLDGINSLVGYEAGKAYVNLVENDGSASKEEKKYSEQVKKNINKIEKLPIGMVTPIIFSFEKLFSPTDLLERNLQVNFDLDGDGAIELWPWVKTSTGILVWNEDGKGEITSGRQMFGSVTWWLFFNDGYHALDCLDDNRDSTLSGDELKGISVWFDTNSNGKSESGEIKSLEELGIVSISTKSTSTENGWPANKTGITLKTGQIIPTYDWMAKPLSNKSNI